MNDIDIIIKQDKAIKMIDSQLSTLASIVDEAMRTYDLNLARNQLERWKSRTVQLISSHVNPNEGKKLDDEHLSSWSYVEPLSDIPEEADLYQACLTALRREIEQYPEDILSVGVTTNIPTQSVETRLTPTTKEIFIVHGHDDTNKLRLEKLIREHWYLKPIVLSYEAGKGRTLIEKFEQEAERATYALVIITPDDLIEVEDARYTQARPNVIFELGWFYGRLGRHRVCILFKKGTKIHSDLDGITRIEFTDSVEEKILDLEKELKEAKLL